LNFSVGAASNYYNIVYETSTLKITPTNQNKLNLNLYGALAGKPFTLITTGGSGTGAITETVTTGSSATNCQVSNRVLTNTNSETDQKFCRVTVTKAASRNYKSESLTADVYFMVFVNDQPTNQVGGGTVIALNGKTSLTIETATTSAEEPPTISAITYVSEMRIVDPQIGFMTIPAHWEVTGTGFGSQNNSDITLYFWRYAAATFAANNFRVVNSTTIYLDTLPVARQAGPLTVQTRYGVAVSDFDFTG
jgi:hypothetical protein